MRTDHRLVVASLLPTLGALERARAPGEEAHERAPARTRMKYTGDADIMQLVAARVAAIVEHAPETPDALLRWWPACKRELLAASRWGDRTFARTTRAHADVAADLARVREDVERCIAAVERDGNPDGDAMHELMQQYQQLERENHRIQQATRQALRVDDVPQGETPSPAWTKLLNPQSNAGPPVLMRMPDGTYVSDTARMANELIKTFAGVSCAPHTKPKAQACVTKHFTRRGGGRRLRDKDVAELERMLDERDLQRALRDCRAGKAGGPDGLPPRFYHHFAYELLPVLRFVYAAITATAASGVAAMPQGFKDGMIVALHKSGPRTDVNNYRPITLLNIDYRIFTRAHASRLAPALRHAVSGSQFGFLPGRQIADAACMLNMGVFLMRKGYAMFCDFRKAFDTVDRAYLFELLRLIGAGPVFLNTVRAMLTDTRATVRVQNTISQPHVFHAGVRQGCPISPLLYLVVGEALARLLDGRRADVHRCHTPGRIVPYAVQYADDVTIPVFGPRDVQPVLDCLATFGNATGQCLNVKKTVLLPLTADTKPSAGQVAGVNIVRETSALGVQYRAYTRCQPHVDWGLEKVRLDARLKRVERLRMSAIGRARAIAAYVLPQWLFRADLCEPPQKTLKALDKQLLNAVDGNRTARMQRMLLHGMVARGGMSALPLREHLVARRVQRLIRWANDDYNECGRVMCLLMAWYAKYDLDEKVHDRVWNFQQVFTTYKLPDMSDKLFNATVQALTGSERRWPYCVRVCRASLHALLREWSPWAVPVLLPGPMPPPDPVQPRGTIIGANDVMRYLVPRAMYREWVGNCTIVNRGADVEWIACIIQQQAHTLMRTIGWSQGDEFIPFSKATVRTLTRTQLSRVDAARNWRFRRTLADVWSRLGAEPAPELKDVFCALKAAARSPVGNPPKEVFLRFWHHDLATPQRLRTRHACACGKGGATPDLAHFAWHCDAAAALRDAIRAHLPGRPALTRANLFLLKPPRNVHAASWVTTALCAVQAINDTVAYALRGARGHGPLVSPGALTRHILARFWMRVCHQCEHGLSRTWTKALTPPVSVFRWDACDGRWRPATAMAPQAPPAPPAPPEPPELRDSQERLLEMLGLLSPPERPEQRASPEPPPQQPERDTQPEPPPEPLEPLELPESPERLLELLGLLSPTERLEQQVPPEPPEPPWVPPLVPPPQPMRGVPHAGSTPLWLL